MTFLWTPGVKGLIYLLISRLISVIYLLEVGSNTYTYICINEKFVHMHLCVPTHVLEEQEHNINIHM